jgi:GTP-binding protein EngB required for normal cell division
MSMEPPTVSSPKSLFDVLENVARRFELVSLTVPLTTCRHLFSQPESINVAVLGGFKAGKSSFINTLAEQALLPVSAIPATAVLTSATGGQQLCATLTFLGGKTRLVSPNDLAEWVTEEGNPHNAKEVRSVRIEAPGLLRWPGLVFLDTPGLGSVFTHNTKTSLAFLSRVEAAVLAISCTQPLSDVDAELLHRLREITPRMVVLLTKADLCSPGQQNEVINFVSRQFEKAGVSSPVYLWSQHSDFSALRELFCQNFLEPLVTGHSNATEEIVVHKMKQLVREACALLEVGLAAAQRGLDERDHLRQRIDSLCDGPASLPKMLTRFEREARAESLLRAHAVLDPDKTALRTKLIQALVQAHSAWQGTLAKAGEQYEAWAKQELNRRMTEIAETRRNELLLPLEEFAQNCEKIVGLFHGEIAKAAHEILSVNLVLPKWHAEFSAPSQPDISISFTFDLGLPWLWNVVPARLVRPLFRRHLQRCLSWEVEKNFSRVAVQWSAALESSMAKLADAARQHLEAQRQTLVGLLVNAGSEAEAWRTAREQIISVAEANLANHSFHALRENSQS